ncbi:MAG: HAD hydrolase-like protein [Longimicrobiales bacterium]|nr:HAD hydrolase-like protein [Longimicrobiales bacterium]
MRRLLLFDIDGTLVEGGPAKEAFHTALLETYGTAGPIESHEFSGKTDPQIARELLERAGLESHDVDAGLPELWRAYLRELEARLPADPMRVLPGVRALVDALAGLGDVALALLTGNIVRGAELKLGSAGLFQHFATGAFGSDSEERNDLPGFALERARRRWGFAFPAAEALVIGDTPRDVACGLAHGMVTVGVATGRFPADALRDAGAHHVVADFSDTESLVSLVVG